MSHNRGEWKGCEKDVRPFDSGDDEPELAQGYREPALVLRCEVDDGRTGTDHRNFVEYQSSHILNAESHYYVRAGDQQLRRGVVAAG